MPVPTPSGGETQDDFIGRCMADDAMQSEFPDQDQRAGVCHSQWDEKAAWIEECKAMGIEIEDA